jgi:hypothetical protein
MAVHRLRDLVVVADAGMVSDGNKKALEKEGLRFIIGAKTPFEPYVVTEWRKEHPGEEIPDGKVFTQPFPAPPSKNRGAWTEFYPILQETGQTDTARD